MNILGTMSSDNLSVVYPANITMSNNLTNNIVYYVSGSGNDANTGLTSTTPFLTIQKAVNTVEKLTGNGYSASIQLGAGTYTETVNINNGLNGGTMVLNGVGATSIIAGNDGNFDINIVYAKRIIISNLKCASAVASACILAQYGAEVIVSYVTLANSNNAKGITSYMSSLVRTNYITLTTNCTIAYLAYFDGIIEVGPSTTISNIITCNNGFAYCYAAGRIFISGATFVNPGNVGGVRAFCTENSLIQTNASSTFWPGSSPYLSATGGIFT